MGKITKDMKLDDPNEGCQMQCWLEEDSFRMPDKRAEILLLAPAAQQPGT